MMRRFFPSTIRVDGALPFVFEINTANTSTGSTTNTQFKLPLSALALTEYDFTVDWGDSTSNTITVWNQAETTHTYGSTGTYTVSITGLIRGFNFSNTGDRLKMIDIQSWGIVEFVPVTITTGAFHGCSNLNVTATDAPTFLSGAQQGFFRACSSLVGNSSFGDWNLQPTNSLTRFFDGCTLFNQNINNWNVSNVTVFDSMFFNMANYNQPMNLWNVGNGTIFTQMFRSCSAFNQNIGAWDMSSGTTFTSMFNLATAFNNGGSADINGWNVSNGQTFSTVNNGMFQSATAFNQPLGGWNISKATSLVDFMRNKTNLNYSAANLDAIYNGWSLLTFVNTGLNINFNTIKYTAAGQAGRDILTGAPNNWTITDGGI